MAVDRRYLIAAAALAFGAITTSSQRAEAASVRQINHDVDRVLHDLFTAQPNMRDIAKRAKAMLVFPSIVKAGFLVGGQSGDGALRVQGRTAGYYNLSAASFGMQAGVQKFSYVLFFMTDASLNYLEKSDGWAIGSGPSIVIVDKGLAKSVTSTTLTQDVYAVPFGQRGLMAGMGLEGSKITHIQLRA